MKRFLFLIVALAVLSGCAAQRPIDATAQQNTQEDNADKDPLEPVNRALWDFNWNVLDKYILKPTTIAYTTVLPDFARTGLRNAAQNLEEPGNTVNNLFQGKGKLGMQSLSRFVINSTIGVFGLIDVADKFGISRADEDFDETMAIWGVDSGPYLMVPVLGPNDTRGLIGDVGDNIFFPMTILSTPLNIGRIFINTVEARASLMSQEEQIRQAADDYAFVKNAYFQNKQFLINGNQIVDPQIDEGQLDDFEDFEAFLEDSDDGGN
jgi:phospholipid-binding lipoprotein MlaA